MATAVRVSDDLVREAKIYSKIDKRSLAGQIEHWAIIGKCAEDHAGWDSNGHPVVPVGVVPGRRCFQYRCDADKENDK